jgi:sigma-B regulation protein RsbU (phosphoserine phosphatase)
MATPAPTRASSRRRRLHHFWARISEGLELNELWGQFKAEARSSYGLYSKDLRITDYSSLPLWKQYLHLAGDFFWAVMNKLSPVRRVLLMVGLVLVALSSVDIGTVQNRPKLDFYGALLILLVLVLEIADRIIMKRDLEIAREIQRWLVPEKPPEIPGLDIAFVSRPQNTVAGDYYDILPIGDPAARRVLIAMADVAGKSLPAALLMATFQASLHTLTGSCDSILPLVTGVNRYACKHSHGGQRFTTAFLAILDMRTGAMAYTNAGHNAPMLRRASGSIERLEIGGVPLGILPEAPYDCGSTTVAPGDALIVFTDGVVEANNDREEEFDEARLVAVVQRCGALRAQDFIQTLNFELDRFVGQARQHDDITCLAVRREIAPAV